MNDLLKDLALAKVTFQLRGILFAMKHEEIHCGICGEYHHVDSIPFTCETGDGYDNLCRTQM